MSERRYCDREGCEHWEPSELNQFLAMTTERDADLPSRMRVQARYCSWNCLAHVAEINADSEAKGLIKKTMPGWGTLTEHVDKMAKGKWVESSL